MSDTPETEALSHQIHADLNSFGLYDWHAAYEVMRAHAESLERKMNDWKLRSESVDVPTPNTDE